MKPPCENTFVRVLLLMMFAALAGYGQTTNNWSSQANLEKVVRAYAKEKHIDFKFDRAQKSVNIHRKGTNIAAEITFFHSFGQPCLTAQVDSQGKVLTNSMGVARCGLNVHPTVPKQK